METEKIIRLSVRNLVEFILKEGDIDNRISGTLDKDAMLMGGRLHRKIQRMMGSNYQAEVSLKMQLPCDGFQLKLEGRADGILLESEKTIIDEIKGVVRSLDRVEHPVPVHLAQAKCYAYIYARQQGLKQISVQMTYCNLDTEDVKRFREEYTFEELEKWFLDLVHQYERWAKLQIEWEKRRDASIHQTKFPFAYREGQFDLAASVYRTIYHKKELFIQASTGTGKTMAVLYPAVKAIGEGLGDKLFYLTAKTITRTVAEQAFSILEEKGLAFRSITLTAKEKICFCEETECNPDACPYAKGHFDRVNDAVYDMLEKQKKLTRESIERQAEDFHVCPFELSLDLSEWADGVICDYNYVFDPNVYLKRFFGEGTSGEYIFLIDEAHNLVDRGREMYSAYVDRADVLEAKKLAVDYSKGLVRALEKVNRQLRTLEKECTEYEILPNPGAVSLGMLQVMGEMDKLLEELHGKELPEQLLEFYFCVRDFLNIDELLDENYVVYTEMGEGGKVILRLFCVNPAANIHRCLEKGKSAVFFSATLLPMDYYRALLSTRKDDYGIYVTSPFRQENRCILTGRDVSSRYTRRGYEEYHRIASYIARTVWTRKGNYMVFFPSYKFMEDVLDVYENEFSAEWVRCISQTSE